MKTNRKFTILRLLVLALVLAGFDAKAASGPALLGKFTLASVTRWGRATLPAGDYSFALDKDYPGSVVTVFRGKQSVARIQTPGISYIKSGRSEIVTENGAVLEMNLPTIGVSLHYPAHNPRHRKGTQEPQLAQIIPVTTAAAGR